MLVELYVERIALIESLRLQLDSGCIVLTGETGAGKSILLDAIGLLLGNRASVDLIRKGADDALVEALFDVSNQLSALQPLLDEFGIETSGGEIVVTRQLYRNGRTLCRINGRVATVQMLRALGTKLVQQHGQHDYHGLHDVNEQLRLLDLFGHHETFLEHVANSYERYQTLCRRAENAKLDDLERVRRIDMLTYQIEEIKQADLCPGEEELLRVERQKLQNADKIAGALQKALDALEGVDLQSGAGTLLTDAAREVAAAMTFDSTLTGAHELIDTAQIATAEGIRAVHKVLSQVEADPARLAHIDDRLALLRSLQRKYGSTVAEILEHLKTSTDALEQLHHYDMQQENLEKEILESRAQLQEHCSILHEARRKAALTLSSHVQTVLQRLNMPNAIFEVKVTQRHDSEESLQFSPRGYDQVAFLFSANKGEDAKLLNKIASGGELSRTLLAIKAVLASVDDVGTLIFDEIDTGVSGSAAQRIAEELLQLGQIRQVLCVTHSAQIAAAANQHFSIEKIEDEFSTKTTVQVLSVPQRVVEVARLLGSAVADDTAYQHADALLQRFSQAL